MPSCPTRVLGILLEPLLQGLSERWFVGATVIEGTETSTAEERKTPLNHITGRTKTPLADSPPPR